MCEKENDIKKINKSESNIGGNINFDVLEILKKDNTINGSLLAKQTYDDLKEEIEKLEIKPSLKIILVGSNPDSLRYVNQKEKWANYVGIDYVKIHFDDNISEEKLLEKINELNNDETTHGFMVQLPLPKQIDEMKVINSINSEKDVDGFHIENQGKILVGDDSGLKPCTPAGIIELIKSIDIDVKGKQVTVLGKSNIVGKPIANLLINMGATVISCDINTSDIYKYTKESDIVISATGVPKLIKAEHIKKDAIIIDVGFTVLENGKISGDCDFEKIIKTGAKITPVPGGVGPMTVAMLMKNTLKAYKQKNK